MKAKELMIGAKPFSNGTEAYAWIEHNCEHCIKFCKSTDDMPRRKVAKELMLGFLVMTNSASEL